MGIIANANREAKRLEAEDRQRSRAGRSDEEQFGLLMDRGHGHCAEAQRLAERIAKANADA